MTFAAGQHTDDVVALPGGRPRLAVRRTPAIGGPVKDEVRPFLLVHGLASNAQLWDGVATALAAAGHDCLAVDLRGHGRSADLDPPDDGYDTDTCADDLAALLTAEGLTGDHQPVAVGQSWGGNVVLSLAARHRDSIAAVACVDGGWIRLQNRFATFDDCWAVLAPPRFDGIIYRDVESFIRAAHPDWPLQGIDATLANLRELPDGGVRARLTRDHHREIVRSLYEGDPHDWYPRIAVPVLLVPAVGETAGPTDDERAAGTRTAVLDALDRLPDAEVRWYPGADHDLHAELPERLADDLLALTDRTPQENAR